MRTLLIQAIACFAALLPIIPAQAAEPAAKKYGGFKPGDKFTLVLTEKPIATFLSLTGGGLVKPFPKKDFPEYKKGQKVHFRIGNKGELIVENFTLPFDPKDSSATTNVYSETSNDIIKSFSQAALTKDKGVPTFMNLALRKKAGSGLSLKVTQVVYLLE